jgi:large subunit ribosomal protein L11
MAKKIKAIVKLHIPAGKATPAPPVGPALAQYGINIAQFCQGFNDQTKDQSNFTLPVKITIYEDGSYEFKIKQAVTSQLLKREVGIEKGSGTPNKTKVAKITKAQLKEVAKKKIQDLNTSDIDMAMKIVEGTAKNMGIEVE